MGLSNWTREELILAFDLYCRIPFGQFHNRNKEVINLAEQIGRTASAVAMKLSNFASLDTVHQARGIQGLSHFSKADKAIWDELTGDWEKFVQERENLLHNLGQDADNVILDEEYLSSLENKRTEAIYPRKVRLGQEIFRDMVLSAYGKCCVCGIPIDELLVASHIIAWKDRHNLRLNPCNGLCLCVLHDKAYDKGYLTVTDSYEILISPRIEQLLPHHALDSGFAIYHGNKIRLPEKFLPNGEFLNEHTTKCFH